MGLGQAEFASTLQGRTHWLVGLFAADTDEPQSATLTAGARETIYRRKDHLVEAAAYGELGYDLTPRLTLTLGGRLFESWLRTDASDFGLMPALAPMAADLKDNGFAPKIRLSYAAAPDRVLYVQAQEGFRTGGFNLPVSVVGRGPGETFRRRFRPDRLWSYEAGGEISLLRRTLTLRAAVFYANWRNMQTDQYLDSGLPITVNIGDGSNRGVEAEGAWTPDEHWQVRANLLVDDPEITRSAHIFPARPHIGLPGVPRAMGALDGRYRWRPAAGLEASVSAQYAYVGRSYLTFEGGPAGRMGGYDEARLSADLSGRLWRARLFVDNLFDQRGDTFAFGNPFLHQPQATPERPRTIGLRFERAY
jgi:outer membrane receptor protein involved in Fe transport